jgi:hypothetical protein
MDETSLEVVNGANGIKRKKTKKVSFIRVILWWIPCACCEPVTNSNFLQIM